MSCAPQAARDEARIAPSIPPEDVTLRFASIVSAHNARAALLETLVVPAATVLRYPEGDSIAEQQLDGFLSLASRGRGAFELRLLGKTWAWLGGDVSRSWIYFAAAGRPSVLHVYERLTDGNSTEAGAVIDGAELTLLTPASLRLLLGIAPIGEDWAIARIAPSDSTTVRPSGALPTDQYEIRWNATTHAVVRMRVDEAGMPLEIVVEDGGGAVIARARHAELVRVRRDAIAVGAWPLLARRIEIEAPRSRSSAILLLDAEALARAPRPPKERFFDLAELQLYLAPAELIMHDPSAVVRPPNAETLPREAKPSPTKE
jgi:hypothetical protein